MTAAKGTKSGEVQPSLNDRRIHLHDFADGKPKLGDLVATIELSYESQGGIVGGIARDGQRPNAHMVYITEISRVFIGLLRDYTPASLSGKEYAKTALCPWLDVSGPPYEFTSHDEEITSKRDPKLLQDDFVRQLWGNSKMFMERLGVKKVEALELPDGRYVVPFNPKK